ncbi:hypothetical protein L1987_12290 [Smallanthus sonchifolius]|uniref:Uncharacterized protein n=1 Tax=Smallanthus sonchifolius TaxID=185202 RepID=A0ACB9JDQ7_9ASTR|nr:hypothetical protein L1987_12290 [Smallanthus sonchifolius]
MVDDLQAARVRRLSQDSGLKFRSKICSNNNRTGILSPIRSFDRREHNNLLVAIELTDDLHRSGTISCTDLLRSSSASRLSQDPT